MINRHQRLGIYDLFWASHVIPEMTLIRGMNRMITGLEVPNTLFGHTYHQFRLDYVCWRKR